MFFEGCVCALCRCIQLPPATEDERPPSLWDWLDHGTQEDSDVEEQLTWLEVTVVHLDETARSAEGEHKQRGEDEFLRHGVADHRAGVWHDHWGCGQGERRIDTHVDVNKANEYKERHDRARQHECARAWERERHGQIARTRAIAMAMVGLRIMIS